jgi:DNA-binding beta-propeller fold protein YncE
MKSEVVRKCPQARIAFALGLGLVSAWGAVRADEHAFLPHEANSSTIPSNGDVNPYGVAFVPRGFPEDGLLAAGDVLVSNFNASANVQGTGTTIVQFRPHGNLAPPGTAATFFTSKLPGLSTALGVLRGGFVLVGNVPTTDGTFATIGPGAVQVIDRHGVQVASWTDPSLLDGPWDLAIDDQDSKAYVFVSNVLNGTVTRLDVGVRSTGLVLQHKVTIATGYTHVPNAAAVVLGPTGLAFDRDSDTLYVASTADNKIYAVTNAANRTTPAVRGNVVFSSEHLRGPLALRFAPNGDLLTANGDAVNADVLHPSEIVEFTTTGQFVREFDVDSSQGGAFGLDAVRNEQDGIDFAVVDDVTNNLSVIHLPL